MNFLLGDGHLTPGGFSDGGQRRGSSGAAGRKRRAICALAVVLGVLASMWGAVPAHAESSSASPAGDYPPHCLDVQMTVDPPSRPAPGGDFTYTIVVKLRCILFSDESVRIQHMEDTIYGWLYARERSTCGPVILGNQRPDTYTCRFTAPFTGNAGTYQTNVVTVEGEKYVSHEPERSKFVFGASSATVVIENNTPVAPTAMSAPVQSAPGTRRCLDVRKSVTPASLPAPGGDFTYTIDVFNNCRVGGNIGLGRVHDSIYGDCPGPPHIALERPGYPHPSYTCSFTAPFTGNSGSFLTSLVIAEAGAPHDDILGPDLYGVGSATAFITAGATPAFTISATPSADSAASISATATVAGGAGLPAPTGTVTFSLFDKRDDVCTGPPIFTSANRPLGGGPPPSATSGPLTTDVTDGTYRWVASYSGDANYVSVTTACNAPNSTSTLTRLTATVTVSATPSVTLGQPATATATVAGSAGVRPPGGYVSFIAYPPDDATCTGNDGILFGQRPLSGGPPPTATSNPFTFEAVGTYRWVATYMGDSLYAPARSACNGPDSTTTVTTTPANGAPEANDDRYLSTEDTPLSVAAPGVLGNDGDPDRNALGAVLATGALNGTVVLGADGSLSYTPNPNFSGTDSFTYRASDGTLESQPATVIIDVGGVNDAPTISDIADRATSGATPAIAFTVGDVETPAGNLNVSAASSNPTLVPVGNIVLGGSGASRTVTITPVTGQSGAATITATVSDGTASASDSFVLTVDTAPPACWISAVRRAPSSPSGRDEMDVTVQDTASGLGAIRNVQVTNGTVSVAPFTPATTAPVVVTAIKTTQGYPTRWSFYADDMAANAKFCDPIDLDVIREAGQPVVVTEAGVPGAAHLLTVRNATPGITTLRVEVNGAQLKPLTLAHGDTTTVDIGAQLRPGNDNTVVLTASGKPGGSAVAIIHN